MEHAQESDPFRIGVAVMIAIVTVVGAIMAWRISVATGSAGSADSEGLAAALQSTNSNISISMNLSMNLGLFADYSQRIEAAKLLEQDADRASDAMRESALREQALRERNLAAVARGLVDQDYIVVDPATGKEIFDGNRYWSVMQAQDAAQQNLDDATLFAQADLKRNKARGMVGITIALSAALVLFTASIATHRRIRFIFAGVALLIFLIAVAAAIVLEILV